MSIANAEHPLVQPRAEAWDHRSVVQRIVDAVKGGSDAVFQPAGTIAWHGDDQIIITPARVVPQQGPRQTAQGRRKRFRATLANELACIGWDFLEKKGRSFRFKRRNRRYQTAPAKPRP